MTDLLIEETAEVAPIRSFKPETPEARWDRSALTPIWPQTILYRLVARDGRLLYVGISTNPIERWRKHAQKKPWWPEVDRIDIEWIAQNWVALDREREVIKAERPLYNIRSAVK